MAALAPRIAAEVYGLEVVAAPQPMTYKTNEANLPSAYVELVAPDASPGTFLLSTGLVAPQRFAYGGRSWKITLRPKRIYEPFSLTLLKFSHDRYAGTEIPKNFSSRIRLNSPDGRDDREVLIYMNNPLRYGGLTFFQHQMGRDDIDANRGTSRCMWSSMTVSASAGLRCRSRTNA